MAEIKAVRPIDANATIEELKSNFQQGSWYGCEEPCYQIAEDTISEMPTLTDCFPDITKMVPLTLEQLREMDGHPVWIVESPNWGHWELSDDAEDYLCDRDTDLYGLSYPDPDGKGGLHKLGWLAYAYPPARIDREALKPCECCREPIGAEPYVKEQYPGICDFEVVLDGGDEITINAYNHYTPVTEEICFSFPVSFCPKCGRPLTEEAWAELEKRLRG